MSLVGKTAGLYRNYALFDETMVLGNAFSISILHRLYRLLFGVVIQIVALV